VFPSINRPLEEDTKSYLRHEFLPKRGRKGWEVRQCGAALLIHPNLKLSTARSRSLGQEDQLCSNQAAAVSFEYGCLKMRGEPMPCGHVYRKNDT